MKIIVVHYHIKLAKTTHNFMLTMWLRKQCSVWTVLSNEKDVVNTKEEKKNCQMSLYRLFVFRLFKQTIFTAFVMINRFRGIFTQFLEIRVQLSSLTDRERETETELNCSCSGMVRNIPKVKSTQIVCHWHEFLERWTIHDSTKSMKWSQASR